MSIEDSLKTLGEVAAGKVHLELLTAEGKTPLAYICSLLGQASGFELTEQSRNESELDDICRKSQIHYRSVSLPSNWWKKDHGPLLVYFHEEPAALIFKDSGYELYTPSLETPMEIDEKNGEEISPEVWILYPPLFRQMGTVKGFLSILFHKHGKEYALLFLAGALASLVGFFIPFANKVLFDKVIPQFDLNLLGQVLLGLIVVSVSTTLFLFVRSFVALRLNAKISCHFQISLWDRILKLPVSFFQTMARGDLIQRTQIFDYIRRIFGQNTLISLFDSLFVSLYLIMMFYYSWSLTLIGLGIIVLATGISLLFASIKVVLDRQLLESDAKINAFLISMLSGIEKLKIEAAEKKVFSKWAKDYAKNQALTLKSRFYHALTTTLTKGFSILTILLIYGLVMWKQYDEPGSMSVGDYLAFVSAYAIFSQSIFQFLNTGVTLVALIPFWRRVQPLLRTELETKTEQQSPGTLQGNLSFLNVDFRYHPNAPYVLKNFNLAIGAHRFVALVGPSGCGKTTACRLLAGFETPERGQIFYDHQELKDLILPELRQQMSFVMQQKAIYAGSLLENITCGTPYPQEAIDQALKLSTLDQSLLRFPSGLHTLTQSGGGQLSGGERQKLLLARALIRKPKVLILDEGLNSLQSDVQQTIMTNLRTLSITIVFATHQLNLLTRVDRIYFLDQGVIRAQGSFEELMKKEVWFRNLVKKQEV